MIKFYSLGFCAFAVSFPAFAAADVYNSFGPGQSYFMGGASINATQQFGLQFVAQATAPLGGFTVAMNNVNDSTQDPFFLQIYTDNSNQVGTLLGTWNGVTNGISYLTPGSTEDVSASGVNFVQNQTYWLVAGSNSTLVFNFGEIGSTFAGYHTVNGWSYNGSFPGASAIHIAGVPEPISLVVLPALAMLARKRRIR